MVAVGGVNQTDLAKFVPLSILDHMHGVLSFKQLNFKREFAQQPSEPPVAVCVAKLVASG
jgi:hypothetical protein